ncbi:hypothetical protein [Roseicyclus amphidinii]|uniref:hypothetical protein n=1 Tax=Roseicyclus amphidinii TaxID=3034232 RepID=UPI0024E11C29|nr:hypothetical protein [Roseicyclus sp. Amp-Y-6]
MEDDYPDDEQQRLIEERLFELARAEPIKKRGHVLRKLISQWRFILHERRRGRQIEGIVRLLAKMNIHVSEGTARNYIPQIARAVEALELDENTSPSDDDVYKMIILLAKKKPIPESAPPLSLAPIGRRSGNSEACLTEKESEVQEDKNGENDDSAHSFWESILESQNLNTQARSDL